MADAAPAPRPVFSFYPNVKMAAPALPRPCQRGLCSKRWTVPLLLSSAVLVFAHARLSKPSPRFFRSFYTGFARKSKKSSGIFLPLFSISPRRPPAWHKLPFLLFLQRSDIFFGGRASFFLTFPFLFSILDAELCLHGQRGQGLFRFSRPTRPARAKTAKWTAAFCPGPI